MEGCKRRVCSWWKTSSSSTRVLGFILPLMVVSGLVVLVSSKSLNWLFASNYYPWAWSSVLPGASSSSGVYGSFENNSSVLIKGFAPPPDDGGSGLELRRRVVGGGERQEAISVDYNLHRLAAPPLAVEVGEAEPPACDAFLRIYYLFKTFLQSYLEMEKHFEVFIYEEGEQPIFHNGPCGSIYSMEGNFIYKLETSKFRTRDPERAHVYFLPFSVTSIVHFIYDRRVDDHWRPMKQTVKDYVDLVAGKYPYWNRASDQIMSCFRAMIGYVGPELSKSLPELFKNSIRALCNANTSEGFRPSKDVSIPEINLPGGRTNGLIGGPSPSKRPILVFFAGGLHGPIRPILLEHWENKDPDVQVHRYLPKDVSYSAMMRKSRFCICPSGYEVASPRMVEALYTGCVPVLIKDHYVPPFSDVLNWKSFSVEISVADIPNLKKILTGISTRQYIRMQRRGVAVRRHFEVNLPPKRYDVFHMTLHSIWLRRLNIRLHGVEDS
ncbi:UNVERIFIED_CONTAM: putative glycosyltransferase [Sesamum calycinum]|uniref:Glycosyltransferase n=1 Tax=Sesamum calycinum TaxID=2727403 RepID=A0AAW2JBJ9_9LAMI